MKKAFDYSVFVMYLVRTVVIPNAIRRKQIIYFNRKIIFLKVVNKLNVFRVYVLLYLIKTRDLHRTITVLY